MKFVTFSVYKNSKVDISIYDVISLSCDRIVFMSEGYSCCVCRLSDMKESSKFNILYKVGSRSDTGVTYYVLNENGNLDGFIKGVKKRYLSKK